MNKNITPYKDSNLSKKQQIANMFDTIFGYADADFASDLDSRKSTTGWIFMYNGGAISWRSSQQNIQALSASEAEYMSLSDAAKEARSLLKLNLTLKTNIYYILYII